MKPWEDFSKEEGTFKQRDKKEKEDNSKVVEGEKTETSGEKTPKMVPLWAFLLMSGAYICTVVALLLKLI